jgi:Fic-DOC domain mobile mystery protein B
VGRVTSEWPTIPDETPIDLSGLKDRSIRNRTELAKVEAKNIRKAFLKYLAARPSASAAPFDYAWMLRVHQQMFGDVWHWAGQVRAIDLNMGVEWKLIPERLGGFALDIEAWQISDDLALEQAVRIHHRTVQIHPFQNGNGRWARLLANIWLRRHGHPLIMWPEPDVGKEESPIRQSYIEALKAADDHDCAPLTELHKRYWKE